MAIFLNKILVINNKKKKNLIIFNSSYKKVLTISKIFWNILFIKIIKKIFLSLLKIKERIRIIMIIVFLKKIRAKRKNYQVKSIIMSFQIIFIHRRFKHNIQIKKRKAATLNRQLTSKKLVEKKLNFYLTKKL
jgi:hypothetical protein